jgi:hypothetical protein
MNVRQLVGLLSELSDQEAEVMLQDSEFDDVSILSVYQEDQGEDVFISNFKPPEGAIVHYMHLFAGDK